jgi:pyruvate/2-oxoglutarate dehydrogenase complex dihydrolipoamide acyltransferase (E2) component
MRGRGGGGNVAGTLLMPATLGRLNGGAVSGRINSLLFSSRCGGHLVLRSERMATFTESVEELKRQYTDKYVVVDPGRPELARFEHFVGQVKTVNMSGRALVEFLDYYTNIGWYDIDLSALTVVEKPTEESKAKAEAKRAAAPAAAKPAAAEAGGKKLSPLEMARMQGAQKAAGAAPAAKPAGGKQSTADILAAARGGAKPAAAAAPAEPKAEKPKPAPAAAKPAAADGKIRPVDKSNMTIEQMIAYCREHDANRAA